MYICQHELVSESLVDAKTRLIIRRKPHRADCRQKTQLNETCHEKTNVLVSDLVRHKPGCTVTEDG